MPATPTSTASQADVVDTSAERLAQVSVYELDSNPYQPRSEFDEAELNSLADSIKQHGLIQPLCARRVGDRYQLIAGERRLRAAIKAGWAEVPVRVIDADDRHVAELAIVENLQRKDLNPLEKAASFQQYLDRYDCTQEELAGRLQIDRSTVANLIRLLELPDEVQLAIRRGSITQGHARALLPLGDEQEQVAFCHRVEAEGLSVRAVESLVQDALREPSGESLAIVTREGGVERVRRGRNDQVASLEQEIRQALGTKVEIRTGAKGRGKLVIHFSSHDEFERILRQICGGNLKSHAG
jgi:ParB family chromosome partitioning protein